MSRAARRSCPWCCLLLQHGPSVLTLADGSLVGDTVMIIRASEDWESGACPSLPGCMRVDACMYRPMCGLFRARYTGFLLRAAVCVRVYVSLGRPVTAHHPALHLNGEGRHTVNH